MKKACLIITVLFLFLLLLSGILALFFNQPVPFEPDSVALVKIEGPIIDSEEAIEEIKEYADNSSIKALVIRVNSPGGAVAPSQEIHDEVKKAAEKKPVVVSMGAVAASGGYYISAPATKIISNPGTITGSIGVIMEVPNISGLMEKVGIKSEVIKSGKHKDLASVFRGIGREEREIIQNVLDDVHEQFIEAVASARNMDINEVRKIADGRIFSGRQALEVGLVDEIGNIEDAILEAGKLGGIDGEPRVVTKKEKRGIFDLLENKLSGGMKEIFPSIEFKYLMTP